jgi:two-component sensor histidine kinase
LGLRLIKGLAKQVGGDIQYRYGENARFVLSFRAWKNRGDT